MRATIRDVARRLNISITTVSRALDGYEDVAVETRRQVIETARELGYTPDQAARQLRRQRTDAIGYILPADKPQFADPFFSEFIAGLGDEAAVSNKDLLVSTAPADSPEEQALYRRWVQGNKVDGLVLNRTRLRDWRACYLAGEKKPFVALEFSLDALDYVGIEVDSPAGMNELLSHLLGLGHRRIAFIGGSPELKIQHDRLNAFLAGLDSAGIPRLPELEQRGDLSAEGGYRAACRLLDAASPPSAIVCINDLTAAGALHAASERGLVVGRDLAVTGFDGIASSAHTQPALTTLDQPLYAIARQLVQMLLAQVRGEPLPARQVKLIPRLILRASTGG